ncbi:MAG: hypothetical protein ACI8SR_000667 [Oceanicoccus sp.]|jgi:hypothetical protein
MRYTGLVSVSFLNTMGYLETIGGISLVLNDLVTRALGALW